MSAEQSTALMVMHNLRNRQTSKTSNAVDTAEQPEKRTFGIVEILLPYPGDPLAHSDTTYRAIVEHCSRQDLKTIQHRTIVARSRRCQADDHAVPL